MKSRFLVALGLLGGCATLPPSGPITGSWGGTHVGLTLSPTGGTLEYDCAAGTMDQPLYPSGDGRFAVEGHHTPGWGGPEIEGQVRPRYRVRFSGIVRGDRMTLEGRVENGVMLGPFELRRGAEPTIFRCL